ncbi:7-carboxy-7-deazaguanine synthase QueE [Motilimonas sp. E26]|uniref:7-carboxy-7-deazaguanine synthase QueE n=1 Tax=Motilimonas sp. E26 TaxID=2865674 RepID=UPI001E3BB158|nr:7-carboxy-7-deazaguanine synthase QueE [Motilimonas sp. E26]MCE0558308.1 7-carboxy-7-deazaguanine synthase QueE [Motilimonas sp. E26]
MAQRYPINEIFQTIQGEGLFTGVPAIFVRLQGCDVGCPWCDTQHTWTVSPDQETNLHQITDKSDTSAAWANVTTAEILNEFVRLGYQANHVVITGGEPCMYDLRELTQALAMQGYKSQIETSGTYEVLVDDAAFVTVSPKVKMKGGLVVRPDALLRANEIKHPVATEKDIDALDALLAQCSWTIPPQICLQPISQKPRATQLAMETCIARNWRLSIQTHKYLGID